MTKENAGLLLNVAGALLIQDTEKAEVVKVFFTLVLTSKTCLQESKVLEAGHKAWSKQDLLLIGENQVRKHLSKLDRHKSMGPDGGHLSVEGASQS